MDLSSRIMSIWVGYYIDVVEWFLFFLFVLMVNYLFRREVFYYCFCYVIVGWCLNVDYFVVVFVSGY